MSEHEDDDDATMKKKATSTPAKRTKAIDRRTAFHEAGHATMALYARLRVVRVTIVEGPGSLGHVAVKGKRFRYDRDTGWIRLQGLIMMRLAGAIAEKEHTGRCANAGALDDHRRALDVAYPVCDKSYRQAGLLLEFLRLRAQKVLQENWRYVDAVAEALLVEREFSGSRLRAIIRAEEMKEAKEKRERAKRRRERAAKAHQ